MQPRFIIFLLLLNSVAITDAADNVAEINWEADESLSDTDSDTSNDAAVYTSDMSAIASFNPTADLSPVRNKRSLQEPDGSPGKRIKHHLADMDSDSDPDDYRVHQAVQCTKLLPKLTPKRRRVHAIAVGKKLKLNLEPLFRPISSNTPMPVVRESIHEHGRASALLSRTPNVRSVISSLADSVASSPACVINTPHIFEGDEKGGCHVWQPESIRNAIEESTTGVGYGLAKSETMPQEKKSSVFPRQLSDGELFVLFNQKQQQMISNPCCCIRWNNRVLFWPTEDHNYCIEMYMNDIQIKSAFPIFSFVTIDATNLDASVCIVNTQDCQLYKTGHEIVQIIHTSLKENQDRFRYQFDNGEHQVIVDVAPYLHVHEQLLIEAGIYIQIPASCVDQSLLPALKRTPAPTTAD